MKDRFRSKWIWISGLVFGVTAGLFKLAFFPYPEYNPPAIYPALIAFLIAVLFWGWTIEMSARVSVFRGGIVGAIVGFLTPILSWPVFLFALALSEQRFPEIFLWSPVYMLISFRKISWFTTLLGTVLGMVLVYFRRAANGTISPDHPDSHRHSAQ